MINRFARITALALSLMALVTASAAEERGGLILTQLRDEYVTYVLGMQPCAARRAPLARLR